MAGNELTRLYVIAEPTMPMTVLICGSPASGFQIIGLFANSADAQSYAEDYSLKDWRVVEVISPGCQDGLDQGEFTDDPKWRTAEWNDNAFAESQVARASKSHL